MRLGLGLRLGISYKAAKAGGFEPEYQAILDEGTAQGYTLPSSTQQDFQNTLVKSLKAEGIWSELDIFYVFATDGDSDFATLNWKDPANFQATKVNAPTFTVNEGFTGDGTSSYLNTNWNPASHAVNYQQNSASLGGYVRLFGDLSSSFLMGMRTGGNNNSTGYSPIRTGPDKYIAGVNNNGGYNIPSKGSNVELGFGYASRTNSSGYKIYENGSDIISVTFNASPILTTENIYLLALNAGSSTAADHTSAQLSVAFAGAPLNTKASEFNTIVDTYMTNLGTSVTP